jgi:N-6 DNA Methylase
VFLLYAEDEGLMPNDSMYQRNYSVTGLYEQLRDDESNHPDTMDQRYGAWAWLLSLFRLVYDGGGATPDYLPARHGQLFDPQEFPFLEGFGQVPRIPDRAIFNILDKLLMLDGERLSYRALDVEQIGSVYEGIMGYAVERSASPSIGVNGKPKGSKVSTTVVVDVAALVAAKSNDRTKILKDEANCEVSGSALQALKTAKTVEDMIAALGRKISHRTPNLLPVGTLYLQPTEERRRSGSHYTPRQLTQPIVETTLRPVLAALGEQPTAEQILNLKICDLAMGSGAFLVEACRQLADALVKAWERERNIGMKGWDDGENASPTLALMPATVEDSLLQSRRLIAQRCLYGVDKNPFAVNLAKMSLWLVTLAKDKPFTFVDHALKCGDSLVGIRKPQFEQFMATSDLHGSPLMGMFQENAQKATFYRELITFADENSEQEQRENLEKADADSRENRMLSDVIVTSFFASRRSDLDELNDSRLRNDVALAAFFATVEKSKRDAKKIRKELADKIQLWQSGLTERSELELIAAIPRHFEKPVTPFHWETEFPEVFNRENPGFDAIAGNPPFAGKNTLINANPEGYLPWLQEIHPESHGNADLVAHFFRRGFDLLRTGGTLGLIATNTIAQGDTRSTGLRFICNNGGIIYNATRRYKWPGLAAVVVSVVHIMKNRN